MTAVDTASVGTAYRVAPVVSDMLDRWSQLEVDKTCRYTPFILKNNNFSQKYITFKMHMIRGVKWNLFGPPLCIGGSISTTIVAHTVLYKGDVSSGSGQWGRGYWIVLPL